MASTASDKGKAMRDQPGQVIPLAVPLEDDAQRLILKCPPTRYRTPAASSRPRIPLPGSIHCLPVLGLGNSSTRPPGRAASIRGSNQRVSLLRQDDGIRTPAVAGSADCPNHILPRSIDRRIQSKPGRNRVPFRV